MTQVDTVGSDLIIVAKLGSSGRSSATGARPRLVRVARRRGRERRGQPLVFIAMVRDEDAATEAEFCASRPSVGPKLMLKVDRRGIALRNSRPARSFASCPFGKSLFQDRIPDDAKSVRLSSLLQSVLAPLVERDENTIILKLLDQSAPMVVR